MAGVHCFAAVVAACCFFMSGDVMAFDIEAHRGGRALLPENTLQSFANALTMGVDTLELDMGVTKDDVVVVSHDPKLKRLGAIRDLTLTRARVLCEPGDVPRYATSAAADAARPSSG